MGLHIFRKKDKTINLILTDSIIRFVEISQSEPLIIEKYGDYELPQGVIVRGEIAKFDELTAILQNCITQWEMEKRPVRFTIPGHFAVLHEGKVSRHLGFKQIRNNFLKQIGSTIHFPFSEVVFDIAVTGEDEKKKDVLLVAAPEDKVQQYADVFEQAQLKPVAAEIEPLSLYRLYDQYKKTDSKAHELVIHLNENTLAVSIFHENQPKLMKSIFMEKNEGAIDLDNGKTGEAGSSDGMLAELEKVIRFYEMSLCKGRAQISVVFLSGDDPKRQVIQQHIEQTLNIAVQTDQQIRIEAKEGGLLPAAYYPAAGLGLKDR